MRGSSRYGSSRLQPLSSHRSVQELASGKYRVCIVGPDTAQSPAFGEDTADAKFCKRVICLGIDEVHAISEWGGVQMFSDPSLLRSVLYVRVSPLEHPFSLRRPPFQPICQVLSPTSRSQP